MRVLSKLKCTLVATGVCAAMALSGCAGDGAGRKQASNAAGTSTAAANSDWKPLSQKDVAALLTGNTVEEGSGKWAVHYASDGRKVVWVRNGETRARKWFINDKGEWCETLYRDAALSCGSQLQVSGNQVRRATQYGAVQWTGKVLEGNPRKL